jgi:hypothetical protein
MVTVTYDKPKWFDIDKSKLLNNPSDSSYVKAQFIKRDVSIKTSIYKTTIEPKIKYEANKHFDVYGAAFDLINNYENNWSHHIQKQSTSIKFKELTTKLLKEANSLNTVIRVKKYQLKLSDEQKLIVQTWISECKKVYNKCIDNNIVNKKYFDKGFVSVKAKIFNEIYGKNIKPCPYDVLTDEVRVFGSNLKSCLTNLKKSNIKHFTIKKKLKQKANYSLLIPSRSVYNKGIYKTIL